MSGADDKPSAEETDVTGAYPSEAPAARPIDPWTELTPGDPSEMAALTEPPPELPGFVSEEAGPAEVTGAEIEVAAFEDALEAPPPSGLADDLQDPPPSWIEPSPSPEPVYTGDGPFAAPVDGPAARGTSRFTEALRADEPAPRWTAEPLPPPPAPPPKKKALVPAHVKAELDRPHRLERRASSVADPRTIGDLQRAAPPPRERAAAPARHYPLMRALLKDPDAVPYGIEPPTPPALPPVPGTFIPAGRAPAGRPNPADLDEMLLTMAEGLLVGESADGGTEVRVTLRDEFFAGTELRIALGDGRVRATLVPPDRSIYMQLNGHASDLEARLSDRGLRVASIEVLEPGS